MPRTKVVKKSIGSVDQFRTLETMLRRKGVQNPIAPLVGTRKPAELKVRNPVSLGVRNPAALRDYIERTKTGKKRFLKAAWKAKKLPKRLSSGVRQA